MKFRTVLSPMVSLVFSYLSCSAEVSMAYELGTHARMTYGALQQSQTLYDPSLIAALGLPAGWRENLGREYNDATNVAVAVRATQAYDQRNEKMPFEDVNHVRSDVFRTWPHGWLMSGAIREDD